MKIEVDELGWTNKCCGCNKEIKPTEKTYIITEITGIRNSIHLCDECLEQLNFKGIVLKNIDLSGIDKLQQLKKTREELKELRDALIEDEFYSNVNDEDKKEIKEHIIEEFWDVVQVHLGLLEKHGIKAEEVQAYYPKHLEKLNHRPRNKNCDNCKNSRKETKTFINSKAQISYWCGKGKDQYKVMEKNEKCESWEENS